MGRAIVIVSAIFSAAVMSACGNTVNGDTSSQAVKQNITTTAVAEEVAEETFTLPSKETFAEVPAEAEESFDCVIKAVNQSYPSEEKGSKRLYGYLGEEEIDGSTCYLFAVYDENEDVHTEVATLAVSDQTSEIYVYNEQTLSYDSLEISEESSVTEYHWADDSSAVQTEALQSECESFDSTIDTSANVADRSLCETVSAENSSSPA